MTRLALFLAACLMASALGWGHARLVGQVVTAGLRVLAEMAG